MKKLLLVACLAVAAFVIAPIASASAVEFTGTCEVEGKTKFIPALHAEPQRGVKYEFEATGGKCLNEKHEEFKVEKTTVVKEGYGELSCAAAESEAPGKGVLGVKNVTEPLEAEKQFKFELRFVAAAGVVTLKIYKEWEFQAAVSATGTATFLLAKEAKECAKGVSELEFKAVAAGKI